MRFGPMRFGPVKFRLGLVAVIVAALALGAGALALSLEEALESALKRPAILTAQLELDEARANLERREADPLALRPEVEAARQRFELAQASYEQAYFQSVAEIGSAYANALSARQEAELASRRVSLNAQLVRAAEIRSANGTATALDLQEAQTALEGAQQAQSAAQEALNLAQRRLNGLLEGTVRLESLEPIPDAALVNVPPLERVLNAAEGHPIVLEAQQALELAELSSDLLDPVFTPRSEIESARVQREAAQETAREVARDYALEMRDLYSQAQTTRTAYNVARDRLTNAQERLAAQQNRLEAGLISELELRQTEIAFNEAEFEALAARSAYLSALLALQAGSLTELAGGFFSRIGGDTGGQSGSGSGATGGSSSGATGAGGADEGASDVSGGSE